ncbi:hypothetical protein NDN08_000898 [Rhodosorus marinus]|uniref:Light-harvesting complex protein n=1 Tax=Rhodosorus marinus TaxID=101924 RepID=A0AAV8UPJ0_9RHOD|nr:hypothetical protein NDN08_000898 [Rhodosorus marinus]
MAFVSTTAFRLTKATKATTSSGRSVTMMAEKSPSLPFLDRPKACDGTMGAADVGFDPLLLTEKLDPKWLQESEIKHGRICMLATLGFIVQEFVHLPGDVFSNRLATDAFNQVPKEGLMQIFLFCGICEFITHQGKVTYAEQVEDKGRTPGAFGFDPLGLGKDPAAFKKYQANEIVNGRLAMIAIGGFIHQNWVFKTPVIEQLTNLKPMGPF